MKIPVPNNCENSVSNIETSHLMTLQYLKIWIKQSTQATTQNGNDFTTSESRVQRLEVVLVKTSRALLASIRNSEHI